MANIFKNILYSLLKDKSNGDTAQDRLDENEKIKFSPKSLRYTYKDRANTDFNKDWKPSKGNSNPDDKLSPKDFFRPQTAKAINGKYDKSAENPDRLSDFKKTNADFFKRKDQENEGNDETKFNERRNVSVNSTAINNFTYDPKTEGLTVQFQNNKKKYFYPRVPKEIIKEWINASSKGEFFLSNIHDQYSMNPSHKPQTNKLNKKFYKSFIKKYKKGGKRK